MAIRFAMAVLLLSSALAAAQDGKKAIFGGVPAQTAAAAWHSRVLYLPSPYAGSEDQSELSPWTVFDADLPAGFTEPIPALPTQSSTQETVTVMSPIQQHSQELVQPMPRIGED